MGAKGSKVSNVANEMGATGKPTGSVIDRLTEAQLDEFREAFNSFDKVRMCQSPCVCVRVRARARCAGRAQSVMGLYPTPVFARRHDHHHLCFRRMVAAASTPRSSKI
jgi:hypothetical protein